MRAFRSVTSWILAAFIMAMFAIMGDAKLFSDPEVPNVIFATIAERTNTPLFEPTGRYVVGLLELFAIVLLLLPFSRRVGSFLALCISLGAVAMHLSPFLGVEVPLEIGKSATDGGQLFYLAMALTAASGLLFFIHPGPKPRRY